MERFFASGHAADVVLTVLLIEAIWLKWRGGLWADILAALAPAAFMILAVRAALTGMSWPYVALPLAAAFPMHLYDLHRRKAQRHDTTTPP